MKFVESNFIVLKSNSDNTISLPIFCW